jgi:hypothetical protein
VPFQSFSFDESVTQTEPGRPHVPEGYYLLAKSKMEPTPEEYEKTTGVFTTFRFKEGPAHAPDAGKGREIRDYSALGSGQRNGRGTQFGFGMLLGALGFASTAKKLAGKTINNYQEFKNLIEVIDQRTGQGDVVALIADNMGTNGRPFSSIEEFLPAAEWANVRSAVLSPMVGPRVMPNGPVTAQVAGPTPAAIEKLKADAQALFEDI